jgi:hypothetical protein
MPRQEYKHGTTTRAQFFTNITIYVSRARIFVNTTVNVAHGAPVLHLTTTNRAGNREVTSVVESLNNNHSNVFSNLAKQPFLTKEVISFDRHGYFARLL